MSIDHDLADKLVRTAARRYRRMCWWADFDELVQEGWLAIATAKKTYIAEEGIEPERYFFRAVVLAMKRALWSMSAPVSGGSHRPRESYAGLTRAGVDVDAPDPTPSPEAALDEVRWRRAVRARLLDLSHEVGTSGAGRAHRVLLEEVEAARLARACRLPVTTVYEWTADLRGAAGADAELYKLMKARKE